MKPPSPKTLQFIEKIIFGLFIAAVLGLFALLFRILNSWVNS